MTRIDWKSLTVHPAADMFGEVHEDLVRELVADIKANGLNEPIDILCDNTDRDNPTYYLLDGRHRREALRRLGIVNLDSSSMGIEKIKSTNAFRVHKMWGDVAVLGSNGGAGRVQRIIPEQFVLSANLHRRHLDGKGKREMIANLIVMFPEKSNRQIADMVGCSHHTVEEVRADLISVGLVTMGNLPTVTKVDQIAIHLTENPASTAREAAAAVGAASSLVDKAKKKMAANPNLVEQIKARSAAPTPASQAKAIKALADDATAQYLLLVQEAHEAFQKLAAFSRLDEVKPDLIRKSKDQLTGLLAEFAA